MAVHSATALQRIWHSATVLSETRYSSRHLLPLSSAQRPETGSNQGALLASVAAVAAADSGRGDGAAEGDGGEGDADGGGGGGDTDGGDGEA
eukprot:CAMPEP_0185369734 /NCGR_PEP_ID=MMETSP1364-20130426/19173_1 /TAXON_ID=38817 /ORGANISM="Gephyrocapsa oceanica, Strain RCC1303" /LENGTH=91 /DNA_ID=CAMNT_0027970501 /DNA_START=461 /DNA_END=733 /DNA_ORIENTATION=-